MLNGVEQKREKIVETFHRLVNQVKANSPETEFKMIFDKDTNNYPFFVVLLMFKAGLIKDALDYCLQS